MVEMLISGGIVAAGEAEILSFFMAQGGIVAGGETKVSLIADFIMSGGIVVGGNAEIEFIEKTDFSFVGDGTIIISGAAFASFKISDKCFEQISAPGLVCARSVVACSTGSQVTNKNGIGRLDFGRGTYHRNSTYAIVPAITAAQICGVRKVDRIIPGYQAHVFRSDPNKNAEITKYNVD